MHYPFTPPPLALREVAEEAGKPPDKGVNRAAVWGFRRRSRRGERHGSRFTTPHVPRHRHRHLRDQSGAV